MAPVNEGIGRRNFLRVFGAASVALVAGAAAFPEMTCTRVGDRLVFHPDVFASVIQMPPRLQDVLDMQRLRAYVVMAEAESEAMFKAGRGRTPFVPSGVR